MRGGILRVKVKDGKIDKLSLEQEIKKRIGKKYSEFKFDYTDNKVFVTAKTKGMEEGYVEMFVFILYEVANA